MLRRRKRTAKQRAWREVKRRAPSGWDHEPIDEARIAKRKALAAQIKAVREDIFTNRDLACRVTGLRSEFDHMHEDPSRAKTRGLPPEQRFNRRVCIRLNAKIHQLVTEKKIRLVKVDPERGFDGPIQVIYVGTDI
jgi:hypothetical protein